MEIIRQPEQLAPCRGCAFVPTMGALHAGHVALIRRGVETGRPVVVSIFVNPTQFAPHEDFSRYPRPFDADCAMAMEAGASAIFAPSVETMYPPHSPIPVPPLPDVATKPGLEDAARPGHFAGVAQVVARLFDLVQPAIAIFGEKDWQQLKVIEAMVARETQAMLESSDLPSPTGRGVGGEGASQSQTASAPTPLTPRWPGLAIIPHPTLREPDGLAMSSRNVYLKPEERDNALGLFRALTSARAIASPGRDVRRIEESMRAILIRHHLSIDYAVVRDARTLMPLERLDETHLARALIAARLGSVRLIDNMSLG